MANGPALVSVTVADGAEQWRAAGFAVEGTSCRVGQVGFDLGADGRGVVRATFSGVAAGLLDGLDVGNSEKDSIGEPPAHPNGSVALDHLVVTSHDVARTRAALEKRGFEVRRAVEMGDRRYTFFRVGETILELVGPRVADGEQPARFFGLAFTVADLDATARALGPLLGDIREAVQPGRRIATLRREAGLSVPIAFMSPASSSEARR